MVGIYKFVNVAAYGIPSTQKNIRQRSGDGLPRLCAVDIADPYEVARERAAFVNSWTGLPVVGDACLSDPQNGVPFASHSLSRLTASGRTSTMLKQCNLWRLVYDSILRRCGVDFDMWRGPSVDPLQDVSFEGPIPDAYWWRSKAWPNAWHGLDEEYYVEELDGTETSMLGGIKNDAGETLFRDGFDALSQTILGRIYSSIDKMDRPVVTAAGFEHLPETVVDGRAITEAEAVGIVYAANKNSESLVSSSKTLVRMPEGFMTSNDFCNVTGAFVAVLFTSTALSATASVVSRRYYAVTYDVTLDVNGWKLPNGSLDKAALESMIPSVPDNGSVSISVEFSPIVVPTVEWRSVLN